MALEHTFPIHDARDRSPVEQLKLKLSLDANSSQALACEVAMPTTIRMYSWDVSIVLQRSAGPLGRVDCMPWLHPDHRVYYAPWIWWLSDLELERLEHARAGNDMSLTITGHGLAVRQDNPTTVFPVKGEQHLPVLAIEWTQLLQYRPYIPATWVQLPLTSTHWPDWPDTLKRLRTALDILARGESRLAVATCFDVFDELGSQLYVDDKWINAFAVDDQKAAGLDALLTGFLKYLNKVGRHPKQGPLKGPDQRLARAEVDHYEAELTVAMALLLTAYIERLPWNPDPSKPTSK
jgi:hypothetical protein